MVTLLDVDGEVLVLERVVLGTSARGLPDDEATTAIADALTRLWRPPPVGCTLPTVEQECAPLADSRAVRTLPTLVVSAARDALDRLLSIPVAPMLLHGDLHHDNLLWSDDRGWAAIDPHGLVGDPAYDVGPLLLNPGRATSSPCCPGGSPCSPTCWLCPWIGWLGGGWCEPCCRRRGTSSTAVALLAAPCVSRTLRPPYGPIFSAVQSPTELHKAMSDLVGYRSRPFRTAPTWDKR